MKRLDLLTSRITYPIALGVFILLRGILTASCVLLLVLTQLGGVQLEGTAWPSAEVRVAGADTATPGPETSLDQAGTTTEEPTLESYPTASATDTPAFTPTSEPTATIEPTPEEEQAVFCPESPGRVEDINYDARLFPSPLPAKLYLPPCYDVDQQEYPVLYLLSEEGFDENRWVDNGVAEAAEERIQSGSLSPFIIVMPQHPERLFNSTDGGPGSYEVEVVEGLVPYIDANYRTIQSPEFRAIGGVSRGGVWAIEISFTNPDLFGGLAAVSPSLDSNYPRVQYDPVNLANAAETLPTNILFLIAEDDPALPKVETLSQTLVNLGYINSFVIEQPGQESRLWPGASEEIFNVLAAGW